LPRFAALNIVLIGATKILFWVQNEIGALPLSLPE
jgi:hypothetical protein